MKTRKKIIITLIIICILIGILILPEKIMKNFYKTTYSEFVYEYSNKYNVDPYLIFAIIKAESGFDKNAISNSEAKGIMQIMENTAVELANELEVEYLENETLFDVEKNIMLGTKYISKLLKEYDGNTILALLAYNAGMGNVENWIEEGIIRKDGTDIENVPFKETKSYTRKILRDYKTYLNLYINNF